MVLPTSQPSSYPVLSTGRPGASRSPGRVVPLPVARGGARTEPPRLPRPAPHRRLPGVGVCQLFGV